MSSVSRRGFFDVGGNELEWIVAAELLVSVGGGFTAPPNANPDESSFVVCFVFFGCESSVGFCSVISVWLDECGGSFRNFARK